MRALLLLRLDLSGASGAETSIHPADPREPIVRATDLGVNRGDGIFETAVVRRGRPQARTGPRSPSGAPTRPTRVCPTTW